MDGTGNIGGGVVASVSEILYFNEVLILLYYRSTL
jgi:hypothetical protein